MKQQAKRLRKIKAQVDTASAEEGKRSKTIYNLTTWIEDIRTVPRTLELEKNPIYRRASGSSSCGKHFDYFVLFSSCGVCEPPWPPSVPVPVKEEISASVVVCIGVSHLWRAVALQAPTNSLLNKPTGRTTWKKIDKIKTLDLARRGRWTKNRRRRRHSLWGRVSETRNSWRGGAQRTAAQEFGCNAAGNLIFCFAFRAGEESVRARALQREVSALLQVFLLPAGFVVNPGRSVRSLKSPLMVGWLLCWFIFWIFCLRCFRVSFFFCSSLSSYLFEKGFVSSLTGWLTAAGSFGSLFHLLMTRKWRVLFHFLWLCVRSMSSDRSSIGRLRFFIDGIQYYQRFYIAWLM